MVKTQKKINKSFKDPVHNYIKIEDQLILDLINSREFQRLRRVKSLGVANLVFHGAEHSRFQHSLGAYEISRRFISHFNEYDPNFITEKDRVIILVSALLHDLGHGAYSHTFEGIFKTNHEQKTVDILLNKNGEINKILNSYDENLPEEVSQIISKKSDNKFIISMISSQIDVDRMDYLLRDAYYTGAPYGKFDLDRILEMSIPNKEGVKFNISAIGTLEDYILSRFQMYNQVYFHKDSRGIEVLLNSILKRVKDLIKEDEDSVSFLFPEIRNVFLGSYSLNDYLFIDDFILLTQITSWRNNNDETLSKLTSMFLDRKPLKSISLNKNNFEKINEIKGKMKQSDLNEKYFMSDNKAEDTPYKGTPIDEIKLLDENNKEYNLSGESRVIKLLQKQNSEDNRFYFPKKFK